MKIPTSRDQGRGTRAMATIVVLTIVSLVLIYVAANVSALHKLGRGLNRIEQRQIRRLESPATTSNTNTTLQAAQFPHDGEAPK